VVRLLDDVRERLPRSCKLSGVGLVHIRPGPSLATHRKIGGGLLSHSYLSPLPFDNTEKLHHLNFVSLLQRL
jgi:hypothetical protein